VEDLTIGEGGPVAEILSPTDGEERPQALETTLLGRVGHETQLDVSGLSAEWFVDSESVCPSLAVAEDGLTDCSLELAPGTYTITLAARDGAGVDSVDTLSFQVIANAPPTVVIVSPEEEKEYIAGEVLAFQAQVTDDHDPLQQVLVSWESSVDGLLMSASYPDVDGLLALNGSLSAGTHILRAEALDLGGYVGSDEVVIQVREPNQAPSLDTVLISPNPATVSDTLHCTYTGYLDAEDDDDLSTLEWAVNGAVVGSGDTLSAGFVKGDTVSCEVTPYDGQDAGVPVAAERLISNAAPTVSLLALSPNPANSDDTVACSYTYSEPDGDQDQSSVDWLLNGALVSAGASYSAGANPGDTLTCRVTAQDGQDTGNVAEVSLIFANYLPTVSQVSISPDPAYVGEQLSCSYSFSDQDGQGDASTMDWTIAGASVGTSATLSAGFDVGDEVVCTVIPYDGMEVGAPLSASIVISENQSPTCEIQTPSAGTVVAEGSAVALMGTVGDPEDGVTGLSVEWSSDLDGTLGASTPGAQGEVDLTTSSLRLGTHLISLTVADRLGASCEATVSLLVDSPPSLTWIAPLASEREGVELSLEVESTDVQDSPADLTVSFVSDQDGDLGSVSPETSGQAVLAGLLLSEGTHLVTVTAVDTVGLSTSILEVVEVLGHGAPSIASVTISPDPATADDSLTCSYSGFVDPDGDGDASVIEWIFDGLVAASGADLTLPIQRDEVWTCRVTPGDGWLFGSPVSESITISNRPPSCSAVQITPTPLQAGQSLSCSYLYEDADGDSDASIVEWLVEGVSVAAGTTLSSGFERDQEVQCRVTPSDGDDSGTDCTATEIVVNTPGQVSDVAIAPNSPIEGDALSCSWTFSDADGDSDQSTQRWLRNGLEATPQHGVVSSGYAHSCTLDSAGVIQCWGRNDKGELDGIPTDGGYIQLDAGAEHSCAVHEDGRVVCWGNDARGDVSQAPTQSDFRAVFVYWNSCALTHAGEIVCWGDDTLGAVSDAPTGSGYTDVSMRSFGGCAVDADGYVTCWGNDAYGHVSDAITEPVRDLDSGCCHICAVDMRNEIQCWGYAGATHEANTPPGVQYQSVEVSNHYECGLRLDGEIDCWSWLGGSALYFSQDIPPAGVFADIAVGSMHSCAIDALGEVQCWGDDTDGVVSGVPSPSPLETALVFGFETGDEITCEVEAYDGFELGNTDSDTVIIGAGNGIPEIANLAISPAVPVEGEALECSYDFIDGDGDPDESWLEWSRDGALVEPGFVNLDLSYGLSCAVDRGAQAHCWGSDTFGQVTDLPAESLKSIRSAQHVCALTVAGEIRCWGEDNDGGVSDAPAGADYRAVDVGLASCAIDASGEIVCWGSDTYGVVSGHPTVGDFVSLSMGTVSACALDATGVVTCWGDDGAYGYVTGATTEPSVALASGCCHTCALTVSGELDCWGYGYPLGAPAGNDFIQVSGGTFHGCALDSAGEIHCWGQSTSWTDASGQVPSGTGWKQVGAGGRHTCAIDTDGQMHCWGEDTFGDVLNIPAPGPITDTYFDDFASGETVECAGIPFDGIDFGRLETDEVTIGLP
jgi:alpha-tubulin suppressor-like RCC1 family protein